jgi:peptidoglycan/LPS O-acetylase OafA/YrhL
LQEATGFFSIFFNAPAFAVGILLFFLFRENRELPLQAWLRHKVLMVALVFSGLVFMAYHSVHYVPVVFIYCALFALLVCHLWRTENKFIANRFTIYLGKISFSCYVWHFVVLKWLEWLAHSHGVVLVRNGGPANLLAFLVLLAATLFLTMLLSHFSYEWIEAKGMNFGRWASGRVANAPTKIQTA